MQMYATRVVEVIQKSQKVKLQYGNKKSVFLSTKTKIKVHTTGQTYSVSKQINVLQLQRCLIIQVFTVTNTIIRNPNRHIKHFHMLSRVLL